MILVEQITKKYESLKVVDRFSFEVAHRSSIAITGPSGCGKTTILRLIAGLEMLDEGKIYINGNLVSRPGWSLSPSKREIGFVFQSPALWPHMTVAQNILFGLQGLPGEKARLRLEDLLARTSLTGLANRYPHQISGGEARRVALARALAPKPRCLLLDEPLTNLDPELKEEMLALIKESLRESEACSIYVTHDASEAAYISEHVLTLKRGNSSENIKRTIPDV
jgi:iron(III) transport system ATP-binding protein